MSPKKKQSDQLYRDALATIHVNGYGFHWQGACDTVLTWLRECGVKDGTVVDLGCGGGQWLAVLTKHGYRACGIDASPSMIRIAKRNAPKSKLIRGSFGDVKLPACDAATSLGEPLNYLNSGPAIKRTIRNVYGALRPGGVFIFDVRHPATGPVEPVDRCRSGRDWFCHSRIEEDFRKNSLKRHITTFTRVGKTGFRRDEETHCLKVFSRATMTDWLRKTGFRVRTRKAYGDYQLAKRQSVFICRKPV